MKEVSCSADKLPALAAYMSNFECDAAMMISGTNDYFGGTVCTFNCDLHCPVAEGEDTTIQCRGGSWSQPSPCVCPGEDSCPIFGQVHKGEGLKSYF